MSKMSRTKIVYINSSVTLISQIFQVILGFVIRKLFIDYLGVEYLGYNSVFANILQMLNLADMGIGVAITSYLYKPLAENNLDRISAIMKIYKNIYSILGLIVFGVGLIISINLNILIPDATCSIGYLRLLFYINLIGTVSTYFLAYKRTLLIADQKSYIANIVDTSVYFVISILQLISLIIFPNYIIYLSLNIAKNIISNILISLNVNKNYSFINNNADLNLINEYRPQIIQYVKDVFVSRIGAVIYYSTDNIILSVIKGSLLTGYLSNYTLITGQLNTVVNQVLSSVQATFGNFISVTNSNEEKMKMTNNYFCVNFCIGNFCMLCFSLLAQPFIKLFFGEAMLLDLSTAIWLGVNLLLTFLIQLPSQVFVIYKLFRYDRPIIIVSATLNIIISIILVNIFGINGVLIGTFLTSLIYLFSRFYIIAKYVYNVRYFDYVKRIFYYGLISIFTFLILYFATMNLNGTGVIWFAIKAVIVGLLAVFCTALFLAFTKEFGFLKNKLLPEKIRKYANKWVIAIVCILIIGISVILGRYTNKLDFIESGNKTYIRTDSYVEDLNTGKNIFSLSFDDTILIFEDIDNNNYDSVFENSILNWYKELHDKYGVVISCYVYYEDKDFNLTQFSDKYKAEFIANSDWLRFGFHTLNAYKDYKDGEIINDYTKVVKELERIVGSQTIDNVIRLQMFKGSYEEIKKLSQLNEQPIKGLYTADDNRQSYYLSNDDNYYIYNHDELYDTKTNLYFLSTDFRTEYVNNIDFKLKELSNNSWCNQLGDLVVFSHEWALGIENRKKIEKVCKYACNKGYNFEFFEDVLNIVE